MALYTCEKKGCKRTPTIASFEAGTLMFCLCEQHWKPLSQHIDRTHPQCNACRTGNIVFQNTEDLDNDEFDETIRPLCKQYINAIKGAFK